MVRCWYHDNKTDTAQEEPHMLEDGKFLSMEEVQAVTGIEYFQFPAETVDNQPGYQKLREDRGYKCEDFISISRDTLPNYDEKMKIFYTEHIHEDEEIRFIVDGSGYFDLRSSDDKWIRIEVTKNDLLILPAGIYHRFTVGPQAMIKARRLFTEAPKWTPINRPVADSNPYRQDYLQKMGVAA